MRGRREHESSYSADISTQFDGVGQVHEGVCSGWLNRCPLNTTVPCLVKAAKAFRLPENPSLPIIMIGSGTGIAPYRGFWQQRGIDIQMASLVSLANKKKFGVMSLYFGCRNSKEDNIYGQELELYEQAGFISSYHLALSREPDVPKTYVQDVLLTNAKEVYDLIVRKMGHVYVCGDVTMAHGVTQTLEAIFKTEGKMTDEEADEFISRLKDEKRFHDDIFGVSTQRGINQKLRTSQHLNTLSKASKLDVMSRLSRASAISRISKAETLAKIVTEDTIDKSSQIFVMGKAPPTVSPKPKKKVSIAPE